jgi:hypothetical protein
MYKVPELIGAVLDRQPAPPRRVSGRQVLIAVASGLDGASYILGAAIFLGLAAWVAISASRMAVLLVILGAIGLGCVLLVAYRVVTVVYAVREGRAVAVEAAGTPVRSSPTFTPWGDMSGIGDPKGAGSYEVRYRSLDSDDHGSIRLQEAWLRLLDDRAPLWLLVGQRVRMVAPRQTQRQT